MLITDLSNSFNPVPKPGSIIKADNQEVKKISNIKRKSSKLAAKERKRYSILTKKMDKCYLCKNKKRHIHEIYKGCNRQISMKNGFCIPICDKCHKLTEIDNKLDTRLKIKCQKKFEQKHTREEFIAIIGQSYIKE